MNFSNNIKHLRRGRGWTQTELGDKIGVKKETISGYEREVSFPDFEKFLKLSQIFDVSLDDLVFRDIEQEGTSGAPADRADTEEEKEALLQEKIKMLEKQIALYDALFEKMDPEWRKKSGLDE